MALFTGAAVALVTPFKEGIVDFDALGRLINWQINEKIDAIVSCGTTGEASTLNDEEHIQTVRFTVEHAHGRVPVLAGAGSNDTNHAVWMSQQLEKAGADGLLLVTPYYNKCTQKGLISHYKAIADSVSIPCLLYSVPGRTGVNISPDTVAELCTHPNIIGIKEASGNISQVVEISKYISSDFALYSGNDDMVVPLLSMGGSGVISTVANIIPNDTHQMVAAYIQGDLNKAREMQIRMKPLIDSLFAEVNPIPVKAALNMMGMIEREYRLPLCDPENKTLYQISNELKSYGLINTNI
ncbi:4-hydroxy-tetrahydrodipicolinate synthase [Aminipila terrae]|uniref:4-hydroxy-tetrahydrodipicolinate synthase n=1 Tax=Aminipila terrae TaxID=2697030 RepID=A0A6P1MQ78_9FIRM|nr:4-hydroxy-tetrahydrodipicolinate synthase [Aminipila terrae]